MTKHKVTPVKVGFTPTCVSVITPVLQLEGPDPLGVLIPEVCGHEGPVLVAVLAGVVGAAGGEQSWECQPRGLQGQGVTCRVTLCLL